MFAVRDGLLDLLGSGPQWNANLLAGTVFTLAFATVEDGAVFFRHWLQHKIPFLWELHKVHHSAEVLTPLTSIRGHPLMIFLDALPNSLALGTLSGLFLYLFPHGISAITLLGANVISMAQHSIGVQHLQHSHVWFSFPAPINRWLVSPAVHRVHHSKNPAHYDKNFGLLFTFWDRMAGTFYLPDESECDAISIGLEDQDQARLRSIWQLYINPLRAIATQFRSSPATQP